MKRRLCAIALVVAGACSSKTDEQPARRLDPVDEASVEYARKALPDLDQRLASSDPGSASSVCAVIKPDLPKIAQADPKLAETLERKCGRDVAVRSLEVAVERAEKDRSECSMIPIYEKTITSAGAEADPEVGKLRERVSAACAKP
jgi:hypothetical protein